jgi:hypothetical protein
MQPSHREIMATKTKRSLRAGQYCNRDRGIGSNGQRTRVLSSGALPSIALVALVVSACTDIDRSSPVAEPVILSQAGPVAIEVVSGGAAGIPDSEVTKLVEAGVRQGCRGETSDRIRVAADPMLAMRWEIQRTGPRPLVIVTASLFSETRRVGFAFDRVLSPNAAPDVVFEYAVASLTCALYRKAGYLTDARPDTTAGNAHG